MAGASWWTTLARTLVKICSIPSKRSIGGAQPAKRFVCFAAERGGCKSWRGAGLVAGADPSMRFLVDITHAGAGYIRRRSSACAIGAATMAAMEGLPAVRCRRYAGTSGVQPRPHPAPRCAACAARERSKPTLPQRRGPRFRLRECCEDFDR